MGERLRISGTCVIDADELRWRYTTSGGPGGQHANRTASRAEVTFDVAASPSLTETQRDRLVAKLGPMVRVAVDESRSQARNRDEALARLRARLASALAVDRPRRPTRPTKASVGRRLAGKRRQSQRKADRRWQGED